MKSFIIIEHEPLTERLNRIWNIEELLSKGINVEYWDVSQLIYNGIDIPELLYKPYVRHINSLVSFIGYLSSVDVSNTLFVLEFFLNWDNREILTLLYKNQCKCVRIDLYANTNLGPVLRKDMLSLLNVKNILRFYKKVRWNIYRYRHLNGFKLISISSSSIVNPDFLINHPDYEQYICEKNSPIIKDYRYAVFIDVYYPLHPDLFFYYGVNVDNEDVDVYRRTMCSLFDMVEKQFNVKVVIAAHPKSKYIGGEFGNRNIIKGQTCNLIKYSDLVITHESNSLSYISLANKPFAIVFPESYKKYKILYDYILNMANICGKEAYELKLGVRYNVEFSILQEEIRQYYINTFLVAPQNQNKLNVDILYDIINRTHV